MIPSIDKGICRDWRWVMKLTKEGLIQSKRQFRINVQMISSIDKMHLQRVEMGDDGDKGRTDTIQGTI